MSESKSSGKWMDPAVPKGGWSCDGVTDLGEVGAVCEMCEARDIRYVHHMAHPDHDGLDVGCLCAGHMEANPDAAEQRERQARLVTARLASWTGKPWRVARSGNEFINTPDGFNLVVFQSGQRWSYRVAKRSDDSAVFSQERFDTVTEAKQAALANVVRIKHG